MTPTRSLPALLFLALFPASIVAQTPEAVSGTVRGRIVFEGDRPSIPPLSVTEAQSKGCCDPGVLVDTTNRELVIGEKGGIANVVISIELDGEDPVPLQEPWVIDQAKCRFEPHVSVIPVGSVVHYLNSDKVSHNVHTYPRKNPGLNQTVSAGNKLEQTLDRAEAVKIACDIHPWMSSHLVVVETNHFAVSGADGTFAIEGMPSGTHTLEIWHEKLGTAKAEVVIGEDGTSSPVEVKLGEKPRTSGRRRRGRSEPAREKPEETAAEPEVSATAPPEQAPTPVAQTPPARAETASSGTVAGRVTLEGKAPKITPLIVTAEQSKGCCDPGIEVDTTNRELLIGEEGGIANVVVTIDVDEAELLPLQEPLLFDQAKCRFEPHVAVVPVGSTVHYLNSDKVSHNIHTYAIKNDGLNQTVSAGSKLVQTLAEAEVVKVACDIHPWMVGYVFVTETPFHATTDASGRFEVSGLPAGTHKLDLWHEKLGKARAEVVVRPDGTSDVIEVRMGSAPRRRRR